MGENGESSQGEEKWAETRRMGGNRAKSKGKEETGRMKSRQDQLRRNPSGENAWEPSEAEQSGFVCGAKHEIVKTESYEGHEVENMEFRNTVRREG